MSSKLDGVERFWALLAASIGLSVGMLCLVALFVILMPKDYFRASRPVPPVPRTRPRWLHRGIYVVRNLLGACVVLLGLVLLALPGQGLLVILVGIVLLDFPGKRRMELSFVRRPKVLWTLNWIRRKFGRDPFVL